ncbi:hypothetical protein L6452_28757 [Arctium lappa]|uniref:Uncharacterized protein n=1 Tax=Arctium lappa TaxID=4217 RepID=A0ACB8ZZD1_ARCLA|nr:hypothetical protein L6452_28757 [Arctium lappa]
MVAVGEPVAGLNPSRWKFPSRCLLPLVAGGRRVQRTRSRRRVRKSKNSIFLLVHQSEIKTNRALRLRGLRFLRTEIGTILANGVNQVGILGFRLMSLSSIRFERYSPSLSTSADLRLHRTFV